MEGKGKVIINIGLYQYINGDKYDGEIKNNKANGKGNYLLIILGTYYYSNGDKYEGKWKDGRISTEGKFTFKDGGTYTGNIAEEKANGKGKEQ